MKEKVLYRRLIKENPQADTKALRRALDLLRTLREQGIVDADSVLAPSRFEDSAPLVIGDPAKRVNLTKVLD